MDASLGRNEPDYEIRELLRASVGLNLALDYLPGSIMFDPAARNLADAQLASGAVWFDAFITNVDRTARNPNLLWWHKSLYLIDHGASLYFHHNWQGLEKMALTAFPAIREHVLLPWASRLAEMDAQLRTRLNEALFTDVLSQVPDGWLVPEPGLAGPAGKREAYVEYLSQRLSAASSFVEEACVPALHSFDFATIRVVPRVDREEFFNAGVIVFCLERKFLRALVQLDPIRLMALWPKLDLDLVRQHLEAFPKICGGDVQTGPIARLTARQRFHWLVAPRSTMILNPAVEATQNRLGL